MKNKRKRIKNGSAIQLATMVASSSLFDIAPPKDRKRKGKYIPEMKEMPPVQFSRQN
jgi:hypothetical protein